MASRQGNNRFRQRKLSTKQNLAILRESELETALDDEVSRNIPKVETGVEKSEEIEHHLQAVISSQAAGSLKSAYIPTPPTNLSGVHYERLYYPKYTHPQTYIRFSSTVEETSGCPYCLNQEDSVYLEKLNTGYQEHSAKTPGPCTEDQFEAIIAHFESISAAKQPYATLDNTPVLSFSETDVTSSDSLDESCQIFAKDIYEHWKSERLKRHNHSLMPGLKFERKAETDDSDPYVCFRRREVRQARKTRGRDAQVIEKLKKLRQELEQARQLLYFSKQRETLRKDQIAVDKSIFGQRCLMKEAKRNLGIKTTDDHDVLVNQHPVEKPRKPDSTIVRMPMVSKVPLRPDGRIQDHDLQLLFEDRKKKEAEVESVIQDSMMKHRNWNNGWFDDTWRPITPPLESWSKSSFREATMESLPTPLISAVSGNSKEETTLELNSSDKPAENTLFRYASPPMESAETRQPAYRRRQGRGGRLWIDRRGIPKPAMNSQPTLTDSQVELMQFDVESDDDSEIYYNNPYDNFNLRYRINYSLPSMSNSVDAQKRLLEAQRRGLVGSHAMPRAQTANTIPQPSLQLQQQSQQRKAGMAPKA